MYLLYSVHVYVYSVQCTRIYLSIVQCTRIYVSIVQCTRICIYCTEYTYILGGSPLYILAKNNDKSSYQVVRSFGPWKGIDSRY